MSITVYIPGVLVFLCDAFRFVCVSSELMLLGKSICCVEDCSVTFIFCSSCSDDPEQSFLLFYHTKALTVERNILC